MRPSPRLAAVAGLAWLIACAGQSVLATANDQTEPPARTTLANDGLTFRKAERPYAILRRGDVQAVIVDHQEVDDATLPGHRAGYSGVASLTHKQQPRNLFVPSYAGLNFEHIHDGTAQPRDVLFEPRRAPMELRVIDPQTVELYQRPTPHWRLESATRYHLLPDGTLEMTLECIPREAAYKHNYLGLFWASYIHQPESLDIHFRGHPADKPAAAEWTRGVTPSHGELATHLASDDRRQLPHDEDFPLTLVYNRSHHRYAQPWYYGVSHGMAFVQMFRPQDQVRITQSPSGGGKGNPAWDFQAFFDQPQVGRRYQLVMRAMYLPYESPAQIEQATRQHRQALGQKVAP